MNTRLYLDTRNKNEESPLKYAIAKDGNTAYIPLNVQLQKSEWDKRTQKVLPSNKSYRTLNASLARIKVEYDEALKRLAKRSMSVYEIRDSLIENIDPVNDIYFLDRLKSYADRAKADSTRKIYMNTCKKITEFIKYKNRKPERLRFEDISTRWIEEFKAWLPTAKVVKTNAIGVHLRNIRKIFNEAIDDNIISADLYPFRKIKIKRGQTMHRAMSVEELRRFFNYNVDSKHQVYKDMFMLSFFLIGINPADLFKAKCSDIISGRLEYDRSKTDKMYSIKIEPEAKEIIEKYKNEEKDVLVDIMKPNETIMELESRIYGGLRNIGEWSQVGKQKVWSVKSEFGYISMNWARHSWATMATELDIPKETISKAMGHSTGIVTDIYIAFDRSKVDKANRNVLDYVLYKKSLLSHDRKLNW